jgi:hypothetical protein
MLGAQDDVSEQEQDHALATMECDVPVGWSLDDWRTVRGLAREVIPVLAQPWWRRLLRASRRSPEGAAPR